MPTHIKNIAVAGDVVYWERTVPTFGVNDTFMTGSWYGGAIYDSALRFLAIPVKKNQKILSALLEITPNSTNSANHNTSIQGEAADSATAVTTGADGNSRAKTTAIVYPSTTGWANGVKTTIDVTAIVREITTRSGWVARNNMQFLWLNTSSPEGYYVSGATVVASVRATLRIVLRVNDMMIF